MPYIGHVIEDGEIHDGGQQEGIEHVILFYFAQGRFFSFLLRAGCDGRF
jgi:hypothetical protein